MDASRPPPVLLVLAGPSASGKSTLCDRLVSADSGFARVVTTTTRAPREGEANGVHYHFLTPSEFDARAASGEFLEWARVHGENRYGTLVSSVLDPLARGQSLVMSVDVQGVASFRRAAKTNPALGRAMTTVFIEVDRDRLDARIRNRGKEDEAQIARRMATAEAEMREAKKFDFIIRSQSRDEDFAELLAIVAKARMRASSR